MIAPLPHFLAQAADAPPANGLFGGQLMIMLPLFVMMWFLFIRPQRQRQKEAEALVKALKVGDEVVTIGGIHGVITSIKEKTAVVRIADTVKVEFDRTAIASVVKKEEPAAAAS